MAFGDASVYPIWATRVDRRLLECPRDHAVFLWVTSGRLCGVRGYVLRVWCGGAGAGDLRAVDVCLSLVGLFTTCLCFFLFSGAFSV